MIGEVIAQYRILDELGSGSMSIVYRAEDLKLGRQVALKFLPPSLARNMEALERFRREARVTSSLNHPNICTVHDFGEHDGRQFIVLERLEGVTLKRLLEAGPLSLERLLPLALDICDALGAAHSHGIVHRDVKPANIFITARGDAKVMDFGLAKVVGEAPTDDPEGSTGRAPESPELLTSPGAAIGTMAYMSPEQARGLLLDARSDIFSFGAVLYEMATGQRPFPGTALAVIFDGILNREPVPSSSINADVPAELEAVIGCALEKAPARRYQTMAEMKSDLDRLRRAIESGQIARSSVRSVIPPLAGHRVTGRRMLAAGALVLSAITGAAAWTLWRTREAAPLTDRDQVLLGDFANSTGEGVFDDTLRQALAVNLGQSPFLDIVGDERIDETLRSMGRSPRERLSHEVGREVCQRQGVKAMIDGSIASLGSQYVVALAATGCGEGRVLANEQVVTERKEDVLKGLSQAASRLRGRLGESLATLQTFDVPIDQATTPSLEALKAYTLGINQRARSAEIESIPFFERAIEIDNDFALAYTMLSTVYANLGESARAADYGRLAFDHRSKVSERERLIITLQYYDRVQGDLNKTIETLLLWEQSYPRDYRPSNSLSVVYQRTGEYEKGVESARAALQRNPDHPFPYSNLAHSLRALNRNDQARQVAEQVARRGIETLPTRRLLYQLAVQEGDTEAARRHLEATRGRGREFDMAGAQAQIAVFHGRLHEARELYARAEDMARRAGLTEVADGYNVQIGLMEALLGTPARARALAGGVLETPNLTARLSAGVVLGLAGETRGVEPAVERTIREHGQDTLAINVSASMARAALAMARNDPRGAVAALEPAKPYELGRLAFMQPIYMRGIAYLRLRDGRAAAAEFKRILDHRGVDPFSIYYSLAPLGLARALALNNDVENSRLTYQRFFSEWKDADPGLPLIAEARAEFEQLPASTITNSGANP